MFAGPRPRPRPDRLLAPPRNTMSAQPVAEIEIAFLVEPADIAERSPAVRHAASAQRRDSGRWSRHHRLAGQEIDLTGLRRGADTSLPSSPMMRSLAVSPILPTEPLCAIHSTHR